jgi:hypothetical protein
MMSGLQLAGKIHAVKSCGHVVPSFDGAVVQYGIPTWRRPGMQRVLPAFACCIKHVACAGDAGMKEICET